MKKGLQIQGLNVDDLLILIKFIVLFVRIAASQHITH